MLIGKVLRIGSISREKVLATNPVALVNVSINDDAQTAPPVTVESLLELSEQADKTGHLEKARVLTNT